MSKVLAPANERMIATSQVEICDSDDIGLKDLIIAAFLTCIPSLASSSSAQMTFFTPIA